MDWARMTGTRQLSGQYERRLRRGPPDPNLPARLSMPKLNGWDMFELSVRATSKNTTPSSTTTSEPRARFAARSTASRRWSRTTSPPRTRRRRRPGRWRWSAPWFPRDAFVVTRAPRRRRRHPRARQHERVSGASLRSKVSSTGGIPRGGGPGPETRTPPA